MRFFPILALMMFLSSMKNDILLNTPVEYPWFIEHIAFEPVDLPSGVSIAFVTDESGRLSTEFVVFKNTSSTPLIVIGQPEDGYAEFDTTSFKSPSGTGPLYKVVNGQAYVWRIKYNHPGSGYYYAWFKESERDDSIWLYVYENRIWSQNATIFDLEPRNRYGEDRPNDVKIPEPQHVVLLIIHGSEQIEIPITVSYTLNTEYRSDVSSGPDSMGAEIVYISAILCFVSISAILLVRGLAGNKSRSNSV